MEMMDSVTNVGFADLTYKGLYKVGAVAALIAAVIFRRNLDAEWMLLRSTGIVHFGPVTPPNTVDGWFTLIQQNRLLGLTLLNLFDLINYALVGLIFLALFAALKRINQSLMAIAAMLGFVGVAVYFASNQAFSMLALSNRYATATTDALRATLLATGQTVLAIHNNSGYQGMGLYISFLLVSIAGLLISVVMLRSTLFGKRSAYIGVLANGFGLGYYLGLAFAPVLCFIPLSISALFLLAWYILIGVRLWNIGSERTVPTDGKSPGTRGGSQQYDSSASVEI